MSKLTSAEHAAEAERLLRKSRDYRRDSMHRDAAGSEIRAGWARQSDQFLAEAQVHATLASAMQESLAEAWDAAIEEAYCQSTPMSSDEAKELQERNPYRSQV